MAATVDTVAASINRMAPTYKAEMLIEINTLKEKTYVYLLSVQRLRAPYAVSSIPFTVILSPGSCSFDTLNCSAIQNDYRFRSLKARAAHLIICLPQR